MERKKTNILIGTTLIGAFFLGVAAPLINPSDVSHDAALEIVQTALPTPSSHGHMPFNNCESGDKNLLLYDKFPHFLVAAPFYLHAFISKGEGEEWRRSFPGDLGPVQQDFLNTVEEYDHASHLFRSQGANVDDLNDYSNAAFQRKIFNSFYDNYENNRLAFEGIVQRSEGAMDAQYVNRNPYNPGPQDMAGLVENMLLLSALNTSMTEGNHDATESALKLVSSSFGKDPRTLVEFVRMRSPRDDEHTLLERSSISQLRSTIESMEDVWKFIVLSYELDVDPELAVDYYESQRFIYNAEIGARGYRVDSTLRGEQLSELVRDRICSRLHGYTVWDFLIYSKSDNPPVDESSYITSQAIYRSTVSRNFGGR